MLGSVLVSSIFINVLAFATPLYSLQLLDRVVSSGSIDTLLMLSVITAICAVVSGILGVVRSTVVSRAQNWVERHVTPELMEAAIMRSCRGERTGVQKFMHDLSTVNQFVSQHAISFFFDVPWALVALIIIFLIHPIVGMVVLFGAAIIILLAVLYEKITRAYIEKSEEAQALQGMLAQEGMFNADALKANGMIGQMVKHFAARNENFIHTQAAVNKRSSYITGALKIVRMLLQMIVMGLGVFLVLEHEMSLGAVIANSILSSKVFAPFEQSIMAWKYFVNARKSYSELEIAFNSTEGEENDDKYAVLPAPEGYLSLEEASYVSSVTQRGIINKVSFSLRPGEILGMIGRNAAGKSTIAKLMAGILEPSEGKVRLDNVDIFQAAAHGYGKYVGYLPQNWQLFNESIAKNIARLEDVEENADRILDAAKFVGMHDMILRTPNGYETKLGDSGLQLSGGQLQGVALARAFYGNPRLVILDEPTSNLDKQGEEGLLNAMRMAKERGITIVLITHDSNMLMLCDKIAVVEEGKLRNFGPKDEVFRTAPPKQPATQTQTVQQSSGARATVRINRNGAQ